MNRTVVLVALLLLGVGTGCRSRPQAEADVPLDPPVAPTPPAKPVELLKKPAIDLSRGGAAFPLATAAVPADADAMAKALRDGYAERLVSPDLIRINVSPGSVAGYFRQVLIDISGSAVRPDFAPKSPPKENAEPIAYLRTGLLRYVADPLNYQHFTANMRLEARQAKLGVLPGGDGTLGLCLVDCATAHAALQLSMDGLRESLAKGVQVRNSVAFQVDSADLTLASDNPRSLSADILVHARVLLIPANFHISGRIDVDDDFNVHFTQLDAHGVDPTGRVVAEIVQGKLDKVNNKAAPLLKMPGEKIHLTGLQMFVGDSLTIDADLAGRGE